MFLVRQATFSVKDPIFCLGDKRRVLVCQKATFSVKVAVFGYSETGYEGRCLIYVHT